MTKRPDTAGQRFTNELRAMFKIGPRSRWYRKRRGEVLARAEVAARVRTSLSFPGYDDERRTAILAAARPALDAWAKHVDGYRIDPSLISALTVDSSPWQWTAYLGRMVDSGCTNVGEFETWFNAQARELRDRRATV
jgi:hypothetical protein